MQDSVTFFSLVIIFDENISQTTMRPLWPLYGKETQSHFEFGCGAQRAMQHMLDMSRLTQRIHTIPLGDNNNTRGMHGLN